ncbi:MAG: hypothetical protein V3W41_22590 [Planctomycetota bacterium]
MIDELKGYHLVGLYRAASGLLRLSRQIAALEAVGIEHERYTRDTENQLETLLLDCRPSGDKWLPVAVVTTELAVLGRYRSQILAAVGAAGGVLYDLEHQRVFTQEEAVDRDLIEEAHKRQQTAAGRAAVKRPGPESSFTEKDRRDQLAAWERPEGSNAEVAARWDVSPQWMHSQYGGRKEAQRKAAAREDVT